MTTLPRNMGVLQLAAKFPTIWSFGNFLDME